jgi:hypothetical protein
MVTTEGVYFHRATQRLVLMVSRTRFLVISLDEVAIFPKPFHFFAVLISQPAFAVPIYLNIYLTSFANPPSYMHPFAQTYLPYPFFLSPSYVPI